MKFTGTSVRNLLRNAPDALELLVSHHVFTSVCPAARMYSRSYDSHLVGTVSPQYKPQTLQPLSPIGQSHRADHDPNPLRTQLS